MALLVIGRNSLPESTRGKAGILSVSVRANGQIGFSTKAAEHLQGFTHCKIEWDGDERKMLFTPINANKLPKGVKLEELFTVGLSEKTGSRYISAAQLFKLNAIGYDYKTAGTHTYNAEIDGNKLVFTLPESVEPKVAKPRVKKAAAGAPGAGSTAGNANAGNASGEPELQEA